MKLDKHDLLSIGRLVEDSLTSPEMFQIGVEQMAKDFDVTQAEMSSVMIACYSWMLWDDKSLKDFLNDWIKDKLGGEE